MAASTQSNVNIITLKSIHQSRLCPSQHQKQTDRPTVQHTHPFLPLAFYCDAPFCSRPLLRAPLKRESPHATGEDQTAGGEEPPR